MRHLRQHILLSIAISEKRFYGPDAQRTVIEAVRREWQERRTSLDDWLDALEAGGEGGGGADGSAPTQSPPSPPYSRPIGPDWARFRPATPGLQGADRRHWAHPKVQGGVRVRVGTVTSEGECEGGTRRQLSP